MEKYYLLNPLASDTEVFVNDYEAADPFEYDYSLGLPIGRHKPIKLYYGSDAQKKTDFLSGVHSFPVVSDLFRQLLSKADVKYIEFHSASLICTANQRVDDSYYFVNLLDNVSCFDWEHSTYEVYPGTKSVILEVSKLAIRLDALHERDLARISEIRSLILVSSRLRKLIEFAQLTGIEFQKISDYVLP